MFKILEIFKHNPYYFGENGQGAKEIIGQLDSLSTKIANLSNKMLKYKIGKYFSKF